MRIVNAERTGRNIRRLIDEKGMSVKQIQRCFGWNTPRAIYKWLQGRSLPTLDNLVMLAVCLDVTIDDLLVVEDI